MLKAWIDESYRAQAPKKLLASMAATQPTATAKASRSTKKRARSPAPARTRRGKRKAG
jgi:hypothetical protein